MASCTSIMYGALSTVDFSLNAFTEFAEFSDKIFVITETRMLPQCQQDRYERQDLYIEPI